MKLFVVVLVAAALGACSSPAPPPAAPVTTEPKARSAKDVYELRERCAKDARDWYKQNYSESQEPIPVKGGGDISSLPPTYKNHYSQAHSGCFAVVSQIMSFKYGAQPNPKDNIVQSNTLWDVNENSQLGAYVVKNLHEMTACNWMGTKCTSKQQWMDLAGTYLAE